MSDLFRGDGGDASAGRGGPSVRTPREVMANRRAREERKQQEADKMREDEKQKAMDAETRFAATAAAARAAEEARIYKDLRASVPQPRQRPSSQSAQQQQQQQPPKQPTMSAHRRSQTPTSPGLRQSSAPSPLQQSSAPPDPRPDEPPSRTNASTFPHAFERWEQLSAHWEGLTSYWLRKIETNTEEIRRSVPSATALSRQIQDLSAAGANLFHAVVELQRLRASSERKFQRWFFETRAEQERTQESMAEMAQQLQIERDAKEEAIASAGRGNMDRRTTDRMVQELRKELNISKAEAKRAWEDLGRMEADQHVWIGNLRQGLPTVIGGVQVVPMHASAGVSHQSSERRPTTSEGHPNQGQRMQQQQQQQYEEGEPSPADTDPFTESGQPGQPLHHEPDVSSLGAGGNQPYPPGSTPVSSSTARTTISPQQQRRALTPTGQRRVLTPIGASSPRARAFTSSSQASGILLDQPEQNEPSAPSSADDNPELFYQYPPGKVHLHSQSSGPDSVVPPVPDAPQNTQDLRSQPSYGSGSSEGTEYVIDEHGQVRHDDQGRPIVYHPNVNMNRGDTHSPDDSYDLEADVARERELAAHYSIQSRRTPATSAEAMASFVASAAAMPGGYSSVAPADYEGSGYGPEWEILQSRHHHPTRLSDVLEEDERSRTTGE